MYFPWPPLEAELSI